MRFLLRVVPAEPDRETFLASAKRLAKSLGARMTHPRWTSYGALEVDVFAPTEPDFALYASVLEPLARIEFTRNLDEAPPFMSKERVIAEAVRYFNSERYWECHEALEGVWRTAKGAERALLQAIILVCAAQVHEQRGETEVALGIYKRALPQMSWEERSYHGIDVPRLRKDVEGALAAGAVSPLRV
jgi:hypothetical protein